jgi:Bacteriophage minor capsid protein
MLSEDIATHLASEGLGTLGTDISNEERPTPDDLLVVREYEGAPAEYSKAEWDGTNTVNSPMLESPRFQVLCRSKNTHTAMQRCTTAKGKLNGFRGTLGGTIYRSIRMVGTGPFAIGRDDNGRERVVCNFEALV